MVARGRLCRDSRFFALNDYRAENCVIYVEIEWDRINEEYAGAGREKTPSRAGSGSCLKGRSSAVAGQDAVLVAFGLRSPKKDDVQEALMGNLIAAMKRHGVRRLVNLSAWGRDNDRAVRSSHSFEYVLRPLFLRHVWADNQRAEAPLAARGVDFINVQPGRLLDVPARGGVRASRDGRGLQPRMTREDLAKFLGDQLQSDQWLGQSIVIGY